MPLDDIASFPGPAHLKVHLVLLAHLYPDADCVTMRVADLCRLAGVSRSTLKRAFDGEENPLKNRWERHGSRWILRGEKMLRRATDPLHGATEPLRGATEPLRGATDVPHGAASAADMLHGATDPLHGEPLPFCSGVAPRNIALRNARGDLRSQTRKKERVIDPSGSGSGRAREQEPPAQPMLLRIPPTQAETARHEAETARHEADVRAATKIRAWRRGLGIQRDTPPTKTDRKLFDDAGLDEFEADVIEAAAGIHLAAIQRALADGKEPPGNVMRYTAAICPGVVDRRRQTLVDEKPRKWDTEWV